MCARGQKSVEILSKCFITLTQKSCEKVGFFRGGHIALGIKDFLQFYNKVVTSLMHDGLKACFLCHQLISIVSHGSFCCLVAGLGFDSKLRRMLQVNLQPCICPCQPLSSIKILKVFRAKDQFKTVNY